MSVNENRCLHHLQHGRLSSKWFKLFRRQY